MCIIELVDYNDLMKKEATEEKPKTRRSRRGGAKKTEEAKVEAKTEEVISDAEVVEEVETKEDAAAEESPKEDESSEDSNESEEDKK